MLIRGTIFYENMINPKLFIRHLEISPNKDKTRLSDVEQTKIKEFRKCSMNKSNKNFYRCINQYIYHK